MPPALTVAPAIASPMNIAPESPMKIRAGEKLCGRKPTQAPSRAAAISGGWEAELASPDNASCRAEKMKIARAEIAATPASSPSSPSMKFIALVSTTVSSTVSTMPWVWSRMTRLPPFGPSSGSHSTCHCTPNSTSTPAARI